VGFNTTDPIQLRYCGRIGKKQIRNKRRKEVIYQTKAILMALTRTWMQLCSVVIQCFTYEIIPPKRISPAILRGYVALSNGSPYFLISTRPSLYSVSPAASHIKKGPLW
jgi:hypothetical protein